MLGLDYQNDPAPAAYDYNYESQDYVEEPQPSLIPQFTTEAQTFKVAKDRIIRLPCRVDHLGKFPRFDCSVSYSVPAKSFHIEIIDIF